MKKYVSGFPRTIYKFTHEREKGFLTPWSSLKPSFLQKKIAPDILGIFKKKNGKLILEQFFKRKGEFVDEKQLNDQWALVFPKRAYLPPDYPHLQLWFLNQSYCPSLKFLPEKELRRLSLITKNLIKAFNAFGYNATPFSFNRDLDGNFIGGQSVRVFHLHFLLMPKPKKIKIKEKDLALVKPTEFGLKILHLVFGNPDLQKNLGLRRSRIKFTDLGVEIAFPFQKDWLNFWQKIQAVDQFLYSGQLAILFACYKDSDKLLKELEIFEEVKDVERIQKRLRKLKIIGKERPLEEIKALLKVQFRKIAAFYRVTVNEKELSEVCDSLFLNKQGDLCSPVNGKLVVLRPGIGYGVLAKMTLPRHPERSSAKQNRVEGSITVAINPLDTMNSKGLMEAAGYWFTKKIIKREYPKWVNKVLEEVIENSH